MGYLGLMAEARFFSSPKDGISGTIIHDKSQLGN
jgi:hypothetical protein